MKDTNNYQAVLAKLRSEIISGTLTSTEVIWVIRSPQKHRKGYKPIIDWYHLDKIKYAPYKENHPKPVKMTVSEVINEIHTFENMA